MNAFTLSLLTLSTTVGLLAGCGNAVSIINASHVAPAAASGSKSFRYTGHKQTFVVPDGVKQLDITVLGASGGSSTNTDGGIVGGRGGRVTATIPVTPGEQLGIFVGEKGKGLAGGFNGGADGGTARATGIDGDGGGGASDIRENGDELSDRVIVAAGGGGGGADGIYDYANNGGDGGGKIGAAGLSGSDTYDGLGGAGGTQDAPGDGGEGGHLKGYHKGHSGDAGGFGIGGKGGKGSGGNGGGGGGGGYYGGGGGGGGASAQSGAGGGGGGGGGSSFVEPSATNVRDRRGGAPIGNGRIKISW